MQDQNIPIFWIKKTQTQKIPILRCRYTAANYTIDVSFGKCFDMKIHESYILNMST